MNSSKQMETVKHPEQILKEIKGKRLRQIIVLVLVFVFSIVVLLVSRLTDFKLTLALNLILALCLLGVLFLRFDWICPVCKNPLGMTFNPISCTKCKTKFR